MPTPTPALSVVRDTGHRLTHDKDVWVASASADGAPYLVPPSFDWDSAARLATPYRWFRISPRRQAWREVNEMRDRERMRDGRWLV